MVLPVAASSAITSLGLCTVYMTPSTTSGVTSCFSSERDWKTHLQSEILGIGRRDLRERAVALAHGGAGVGEPVLRFLVGAQDAFEGNPLNGRFAAGRALALARCERREGKWQESVYSHPVALTFLKC